MEQWGNIQDVKELAIMVEHVIIQKLGMELQLVVNLVVGWCKDWQVVLQDVLKVVLNGANNYFQQLQYLVEL